MDITWLLVIIFFVGLGLWTKRQNTQHIRRLRAEDEAKYAAVKEDAEAMTKPFGFKPGVFDIKPPRNFKEAATLANTLNEMKRKKP